MNWFKRFIFTGFEPNITRADVRRAVRMLWPWRISAWQKGPAREGVRQAIEDVYSGHSAVLFDSGRTAILVALKAMGVKPGVDVLVQGFTCVVVINAIRWAGGNPVYVDVLDNFTLNPDDVVRKITPNTRVLIVQHTFGIAAEMNQLIDIARANQLMILEDCAHVFGGVHHGRLLGSFGDAAIFSFGSDKPLSCVRGGALVSKNDDIAAYAQAYETRLPHQPRVEIFLHLMHYLFFPLGRSLYHIGVGKWLFFIGKQLGWWTHVIDTPEKEGKQVWPYPAKLPNALATILLWQLRNYKEINLHRREVVARYEALITNKALLPEHTGDTVFLRFPLIVGHRDALLELYKHHHMLLGNWYDTVVAPHDSKVSATLYLKGKCPNAERLARLTVNLPTDVHIGEHEVRRLVSYIDN